MKDELGNRMKTFYENRTKTYLTRRSYTVIRIDGKAFHSYTKGLEKPFDSKLIRAMDKTAEGLCEKIQGAKFAYTQSDEISILLTDFDNLETNAWFDNSVQKIVSVSASIATAVFNQYRIQQTLEEDWTDIDEIPMALFDSRVFQIPTRAEVINYFLWRQKDAIRNSVSMLAQSAFSHKALEGINTTEKKLMLEKAGQSWESLPLEYRMGRISSKVQYNEYRTVWATQDAPDFHSWHTSEGLIPEN